MKLLLAAIAAAVAQPASMPEPILLGSSHHLASKALGEDRIVNIVLPLGYGKDPRKRYPVLYLIDGGVDQDLIHVAGASQLGAIWGRSADAIIVGIATKDRRKELTGPTADAKLMKEYPTAGHSTDFRAFIRDEVKPFVERGYRTNGEDAIVGESLAGLFIVETLLVEPQLFDAFGAIDPSLWWDNEALSKRRFASAPEGRSLYLAIAKEQSEKPAAAARVLAEAPAKTCFNERADLTHATIYQQVIPQALQFLLPPAESPPPEFGFEVRCSKKS